MFPYLAAATQKQGCCVQRRTPGRLPEPWGRAASPPRCSPALAWCSPGCWASLRATDTSEALCCSTPLLPRPVGNIHQNLNEQVLWNSIKIQTFSVQTINPNKEQNNDCYAVLVLTVGWKQVQGGKATEQIVYTVCTRDRTDKRLGYPVIFSVSGRIMAIIQPDTTYSIL